MAQEVKVEYIDDIDGGPAAGVRRFSLDGAAYEIDLSEANGQFLTDALAPFISAGRRVRTAVTTKTTRGGGTVRVKRHNLAEVRDWARENGHQVSDRGRVSGEVLAAYDAAH